MHTRAILWLKPETLISGETDIHKEKLLRDDIAQKQLYMIEQDGAICGVFVFIIGEDPTYAVIDEGAWLSNAPYGTIHRVASNGTVHGIMKQIVGFCRAQIHHLRIDTHADNHIMQHLILQCGFTRPGHYLRARRFAQDRL